MPFTNRMLAWGFLLAVVLASCTGSNEVEVGKLTVSVATTGSRPDADGYTVTVGERSAEPIRTDGEITISELLPGDYPVRLSGLSASCFVVGTNPTTGRVTAGGRATASFAVSCPGTGARVKVTMTSTGSDLDSDGYILKLGEDTRSVATQGVTTLSIDQDGELAVELSDLSPNCTADPANPATVRVTLELETPLPLKVACAASTGAIRVTVATSGADAQQGGFGVWLDAAAYRELDSSNTTTFVRLTPGAKTIALSDYSIQGNCRITGSSSKAAVVVVGDTVEVTFPVACTARARVVATVSTLGQGIDVDGYRVGLGYSDYYYGSYFQYFDVPANGTATSPAIYPATYQVVVDGLAPNCRLIGASPNPVVMGTADIPLVIAVQCDAARQLAFVTGTGTGTEINVGSETGTYTRLTSNTVADSNPAWSPDGARLAFASARDGNSEIYVMNADGSNVLRLTNNAAADYQPAWSSDGSRIAFVSQRDGNAEIYVMATDGSNPVRLTTDISRDVEPAWSPSGDRILFVGRRIATSGDIYVMNADGSGVAKLTTGGYTVASPAWSTSGGQVAYMRFGTFNTNTLHLMNADGSLVTDQLISSTASTSITWAPDARVALTQASQCNDFGCLSTAVTVRRLDGSLSQLPWSASSEPAWRP